ncbi:MAG: iron-containing alcohol dehydrogenase [Lachnospiraceae bacterium]|nr:iron-containing alcohol dehydrogenase [Lachnospiraceae bacterium]
MKPHQINIPAKIYFGRDIWEESIKDIEALLSGNVMIVTTGRSLTRLGYLERLKEQLSQCALTKMVTVFDKVSANPRLSEVREGIELAKESSTDVVVGFGGGSAIDMAKAVAAGAGAYGNIDEYFYNGKEPVDNVLPIIAIPTTAGTGSELSKAAIITDDVRKIKSGIRGVKLYPKAAIVDSVFTESVPFHITMETGFDVFAHAMESYLSKAASPFTQMQSEHAARIVGEMLPRLVLDMQDIEARKYMSYASMIMGINLGNASTGLPHRLQYPLGAATDTSHGKGLAALYTAWVHYEYLYSEQKTEKLMRILMGKDIRGREECTSAMHAFITSLKLPTSLRDFNIKEEQMDDMARAVSGSLFNDPAAQEPDIIRKIYRKAWEG